MLERQTLAQAGLPIRREPQSAANAAKSTQLSVPQTNATSAIVRMSRRSSRCAVPVRGSAISRTI
jgi:hypothetical protein